MKNKIFFLLVTAIAVSSLRLLPHPANFIPIGAFSIFIANKFPTKYTVFFAILPMVISDIFLGFGWYSPFVYAGLLGYFVAGKYVKGYKTLIGAGLASSLWFFVISNTGVWLGPWYPHNLPGFIDCFIKAIPFFKNTILGDFMYLGLFYGVYEICIYLNKNYQKYKELKWQTKY